MYAHVLLPLYIENALTYRVPEHLMPYAQKGKRVVVELRKSIYTGIIVATTEECPKDYFPKDIVDILDDVPCVTDTQLKLWEWISKYYCCTTGEVMRAALPSAMKIESATKIELTGEDFDSDDLSDEEYLIYEALSSKKSLSAEEVQSILDKKNVIPIIKSMINKGVVCIYKEYAERYRPKKEQFIYRHEHFDLEAAMNLTKHSGKQRSLLMAFLSMESTDDKISKKSLLERSETDSPTLNALVKKEILTIREETTDRLTDSRRTSDTKTLSPAQRECITEIERGFSENKTVLLHGVTGSGKTEIYIDLISRTIKQGGQCLFLLPEIALTAQLIERLKNHFGNKVGVYHSKYNEMERTEVWLRSMRGDERRFDVIVGVRSAVFLPFADLRLIIIDEEHDPSFKQNDPAPRYHGRDTALMLAHINNAHVLMGSATPAVESYHNALTGKYHLVNLTERYQGIKLPDIHVVNLREAYATGEMRGHFSKALINSMADTLDAGQQVILFQNRRGYAPVVECLQCGWTEKCTHCDVNMTYHSHSDSMKCHYCGHTAPRPRVCPVCGGIHLDTKGFGTQQIEEEVTRLFPSARVLRMDSDTTQSKHAHSKIINKFAGGEADILIGTQMISKGLDFDRVTLVGILNADNTFKNSDFRAYERGFQTLCQISGRAGRKECGRVILQSYDPQHTVIRNVCNSDYQNMYHEIMRERKEFLYPPLCRMIRIVFKHKDSHMVEQASQLYAAWLSQIFTGTVMGPEDYYIPRINNVYIKHLFLKISPSQNIPHTKRLVRHLSNHLTSSKEFRNVRVTIDVDPA